jgi:hypothetical protein
VISAFLQAVLRQFIGTPRYGLSFGAGQESAEATVTAGCEDRLRQLEEALSKHQFTATR